MSNWLQTFLMMFLSVFLIMVIIYIIKRVGVGIPVIDEVVKGVWN